MSEFRGEIWHIGWDIPTKFKRTADGAWLRNEAHGGEPTGKTTAEALIALALDEGQDEVADAIAKAAGLPAPEPEWMRTARANGWRPPEG